jgi:Fe-Mn family superoxide dismutase
MKTRFFYAFFLVAIHCCFAQRFVLPNLKYSYSEFEPYIDAQTMMIHHSKHHQAYVNNLNQAITGTNFENSTIMELFLNTSSCSEVIRNNAGGYFNHSLFWDILAPKEKQKATIDSEFERAVINQFGHRDTLKNKLVQAASARFGSGWAWLVVTPQKKLIVTHTPNQDNPIMDIVSERGIPILAIDVWEHAYYLKYQNKRGAYLEAIWNLVDWGVVADKYLLALDNPVLQLIKKD